MNRRAFVTGLGAVLAAATAARAQQAGNVPRVGILLPGFRPSPERIARGPFIVPMRELGWVDGRSVVFERRYANERPELLPMLARELIASRVDVIVTSSTPATRAAKEATATIPIVFSEVSQPLSQGFAASLTRPGGKRHGHKPDDRCPGGKEGVRGDRAGAGRRADRRPAGRRGRARRLGRLLTV